jgi:hypothetical protein
MKFTGLKIPKKTIKTMEDPERIFFIQFGEILNEIDILYRCFLATSNLKWETEVEQKAKISQLFFFIRSLASKLYEGWIIIKSGYVESALSLKIDKALGMEATESLSEIRKYFGRKNNIVIIRNKLGFHYEYKMVGDGINNLEEIHENDLKIFLTPSIGNCIYSLSDAIIFAGMKKDLMLLNRDDIFDQLMDEITNTCRHFQTFGDECLRKIMEPHQDSISCKENYEITTAPQYSEIKLPQFIEIQKKQ